LVAEGKLDDALAILVEASQANPQDQAIQLDAVDVLMQLGRKDEAGQLLAGDYTNEADRANALRARLALPRRRRHRPAGSQTGPTPTITPFASNCPAPTPPKPLPRGAGSRAGSRRRDRFNDGAGRKAILAVFEALPANSTTI
jgi:putative thioredoxin